METKSMLYLVSEFVPKGEIFGKKKICFESVNERNSEWRFLFILSLSASDVRLNVFSSEYIARHGRMSEKVARQKFWQIIRAVEYCHTR